MRKLALLALAGVLCLSGSAFATEPGSYYLQLAIGTAPLCGPQVCNPGQCNAPAIPQFSTAFVTAIVDCHKGEGFRSVEYGLSESSNGTLMIHTGFAACAGFLQGPGQAPGQMVVASTVGCQECCTAVGNHSYLVVGAGVPIVWSVGPNNQTGNMGVVDCNLILIQAVCSGQATLASATPVACQCAGPTANEPSSWGNLKALYN